MVPEPPGGRWLWIRTLKSWLVHITQLAETRMYRHRLRVWTMESTLSNDLAEENEYFLCTRFVAVLLCWCPLFSPHWTFESMLLCLQQSAVEGTIDGPPRAFHRSQLLWRMASQAPSCLSSQRITLDWWRLSSQGGSISVLWHTGTSFFSLAPANRLVLLPQIGTTL